MSRRDEGQEFSSGQVKQVIKKATSLIDLLSYVEKSQIEAVKKETTKEFKEKEIISKLEGQRQDLVDISFLAASGFSKYLQSKEEFNRAFKDFKNYIKNDGSKISIAALCDRLFNSDEIRNAIDIDDSDIRKLGEAGNRVFNEMELGITSDTKTFINTNIYPDPIAIPEDLHPSKNVTSILKPRLSDVLRNLDRFGNAAIAVVPNPDHMKNFDSTDPADVLSTAIVGGVREYDRLIQKIKENGLGGIQGGAFPVVAIIFIAIGAALFLTGFVIRGQCISGAWSGTICAFGTVFMIAGFIIMAVAAIAGCVATAGVGCAIAVTAPTAGGGTGTVIFPIR